jgi:hypothetical protein
MTRPTAPPPQPLVFYQVVESLSTNHIPLENLIRRSLVGPVTKHSEYVNYFIEELPRLLGWLAYHEHTREIVKGWMKEEYTELLTSQLCDLARPKNGFYIDVGSITAEKIEDFTIRRISEGILTHAPDVWDLVGGLLEADPIIVRKHEKDQSAERWSKK